MSQSLSVVLAVHNGEKNLEEKIHTLLDMLPDLTPWFEILIVDDGSTDHTSEVAYDLSREFPQVQFVQHSKPTGWAGIVETALSRTWGEYLFIQDAAAPIASSKFKRLWALRTSPEIVSRIEALNKSNPARHMAALGVRLDDGDQSTNGLQMIRRPARIASRASALKVGLGAINRLDQPQQRSIGAIREVPIGSVNAYSATP